MVVDCATGGVTDDDGRVAVRVRGRPSTSAPRRAPGRGSSRARRTCRRVAARARSGLRGLTRPRRRRTGSGDSRSATSSGRPAPTRPRPSTGRTRATRRPRATASGRCARRSPRRRDRRAAAPRRRCPRSRARRVGMRRSARAPPQSALRQIRKIDEDGADLQRHSARLQVREPVRRERVRLPVPARPEGELEQQVVVAVDDRQDGLLDSLSRSVETTDLGRSIADRGATDAMRTPCSGVRGSCRGEPRALPASWVDTRRV